ncbi:hypothetical protein F2P56_030971 [Juglans regia]|uniref:phosphoenolpyruvate carboxykinase (ATP) n=2 Tax=Juglans regia TaxID=51240 RepID=A0A833X8K9_JUGRE|nr:uncharacterized protein LOC109012404 isoform X3 [Juglans regia]KAF5450640.1 hypothetical protein F2P56_030971 [Juglans regia]
MRNLVLKCLLQSSRSFTRPSSSRSSPFLLSSRWYSVSAPRANEEAETVVFPREGPGFSHGLQWALAAKGILVKENAFRNLESSELQQKGANIVDSLSGLPVYVRGSIVGGASEISKSQFGKLLKQVSNHISSISDVFVHDGAIGSSPKCDAKVRVISDSPSAVLSLSNVLWKTPTRAVSHDSCPLTVYVATSISPGVGDTVGLGAKMSKGFIAADIERSSLILCGKAFSDTNGIKEALASLSGPIISSRGGLPLSGSSGSIPSASKLSPGQAAYHFLAGYQNGKFLPAYSKGSSSIDLLELAMALRSKLQENQIPSFLINVNEGEKSVTGKDLVKLVESTLSKNIPQFEAKGGKLQGKYKSFLSGKFQDLPKEFSF